MTALPKQILMGPYMWTVAKSKQTWDAIKRSGAGDDGCIGFCEAPALTIHIQPELPPSLERETLLHEILHAAAFTAGIHDERKHGEEKWASHLSPPLLDALRRTEGLLEYLTDPG